MAYNILVILGPTASGKTSVAAQVASMVNGEIISADSRQVYKRMDLGTGKDYDDYKVNGNTIPFRLLDILEPGIQYNVYEYQRDFKKAFEEINSRSRMPILCGGSGLYIEAVLSGYQLTQTPINQNLREELASKTLEELTEILSKYRKPHNQTDTINHKRAIRAIEIEVYKKENPGVEANFPKLNPLIIGVRYDRQTERQRITRRLDARLQHGMIDEVKSLLASGLTAEQLIYYGLEYKFITQHLTGLLSFDDMRDKLNTAIHQFAKRQMTWFRRMERNGYKIHWISGELMMEDKVERVLQLLY